MEFTIITVETDIKQIETLLKGVQPKTVIFITPHKNDEKVKENRRRSTCDWSRRGGAANDPIIPSEDKYKSKKHLLTKMILLKIVKPSQK